MGQGGYDKLSFKAECLHQKKQSLDGQKRKTRPRCMAFEGLGRCLKMTLQTHVPENFRKIILFFKEKFGWCKLPRVDKVNIEHRFVIAHASPSFNWRKHKRFKLSIYISHCKLSP